MRFDPCPIDLPLRDVASESGGKALGDLPVWDLTDLYASSDAPELTRDLKWLEEACADFAKTYEGKLADLDAAGLLACVAAYEKIDMIAGRTPSLWAIASRM